MLGEPLNNSYTVPVMTTAYNALTSRGIALEDNVVPDVYGLTSLGQTLKAHKPVGVTDAQIDLLLSHC